MKKLDFQKKKLKLHCVFLFCFTPLSDQKTAIKWNWLRSSDWYFDHYLQALDKYENGSLKLNVHRLCALIDICFQWLNREIG